MQALMKTIGIIILLMPLFGSIISGVFGNKLERKRAHQVTIAGVFISFLCSIYLLKLFFISNISPLNVDLYTWLNSGSFSFHIGLLLDRLSVIMACVVTFVSLLVHIYTIGYMADDPGYQRFFSYISLFTFAMLCLVLSNNMLQLFFGWEGVGLASYLLISFWYKRDKAINGGMKAFLVNRVGDFGFLLGIACTLSYFGTLDYSSIFVQVPLLHDSGARMAIFFAYGRWHVLDVICVLLFIGAMGKSAQIPLHVWLPESMEGPTPISALIHAATMVTAGIFMVSRLSPLFERAPIALSFILVIGATTALFMGLIAIVNNDIKRVVAYSTLSQLGYMITALGASAYAAGFFHLVTHAFFKALLFLGAGSVIMAMHHEQDIRLMGGLKKYMPITYITFVIGSFALAGLPPFSGFYSKDAIIEAVALSSIPGSSYAYFCLLMGVLVTAIYTFRLLFIVFHGKERMDNKTKSHLKESPKVVTAPLILLAVPSVVIGALLIKGMLFTKMGLLGKTIFVLPANDVLHKLSLNFHGAMGMMLHAVTTLPFWFTIVGVFIAWYSYVKQPELPQLIANRFQWFHRVLENKYGFDEFNEKIIVRSIQFMSQFLYNRSDIQIIDRAVNGSAKSVGIASRLVRLLQTGYLYHYVFMMVLGVLLFFAWNLLGKM